MLDTTNIWMRLGSVRPTLGYTHGQYYVSVLHTSCIPLEWRQFLMSALMRILSPVEGIRYLNSSKSSGRATSAMPSI